MQGTVKEAPTNRAKTEKKNDKHQASAVGKSVTIDEIEVAFDDIVHDDALLIHA